MEKTVLLGHLITEPHFDSGVPVLERGQLRTECPHQPLPPETGVDLGDAFGREIDAGC